VGTTLGEGAFGVVRLAQHRTSGKEYAVKMVDKVETPVPAIMREAEMLKALTHPNVVKFVDVFIERCFVCIVMEIYRGGDLVDGLQRQGPFPSDKIIHIAHQLAAAIDHLHANKVAHRDVKGDNYMMDRQDMLDSGCTVVITDFGTASYYKESEPFTSQCGTRQFWAPELLEKKYGMKVDVWALGVLMYGLVTGRFPFRDENDIRKKEVKIRTRCDEVCQDYVLTMLEKSEAKRPDSKAVMAHAYLKSMQPVTRAGTEDTFTDGESSQMIREDGANVGIKDRRHELVERMQQQQRGGASAKRVDSLDFKPFVVDSKIRPGTKLSYEWWDSPQMTSSGLLDPMAKCGPAPAELFRDVRDLSLFEKMLQEHGIDTAKFGVDKHKNLKDLAAEVRNGEARLMLDATAHKKLVRVVDVLVLRLYSSDTKTHLVVETALAPEDGRKYETYRLPGQIKAPHDNVRKSCERLLATLNLKLEHVSLDIEHAERNEEEYESASYPGLQTFYNKDVIEGVVNISAMSLEELSKIGLPDLNEWTSKDRRWGTKFNQWMTKEEAFSRNVILESSGLDADASTLVNAPIGLNEDDLRARLAAAGIDVNQFGKNGTRTLKDFSHELYRGEAFVQENSTGELVRTVNVVIIILSDRKSGKTLVQTKQSSAHGAGQSKARLPGNKCRPDENHFICARKIIRRELEIDDNSVYFNEAVMFVEEEDLSTNYPGIKTIYRKFLIRAEL